MVGQGGGESPAGGSPLLGLGMALAAAVSGGLHTLIYKRLFRRMQLPGTLAQHIIVVLCLSVVGLTLVGVPIALAPAISLPDIDGATGALFLPLGILAYAGHVLFYYALMKLDEAELANIQYFQPVVVTVLLAVLVGDPIGIYFVAGSALIFGAQYGMQRRPRQYVPALTDCTLKYGTIFNATMNSSNNKPTVAATIKQALGKYTGLIAFANRYGGKINFSLDMSVPVEIPIDDLGTAVLINVIEQEREGLILRCDITGKHDDVQAALTQMELWREYTIRGNLTNNYLDWKGNLEGVSAKDLTEAVAGMGHILKTADDIHYEESQHLAGGPPTVSIRC